MIKWPQWAGRRGSSPASRSQQLTNRLSDRRGFIALSSIALLSCEGGGGGGAANVIDHGAETDSSGLYVVSDWGAVEGDPSADLGEAFENIFADIDSKGLSGALIYIPAGTFYLLSTVTIRHDHLSIQGANHGFASGTGNGGGSRVIVRSAVGFRVPNPGQPRIRGLLFSDFLLDGESVAHGRRGILIERDNDALVIRGMTLKEFDAALVVRGADATLISGNRILENSSCLRLERAGKAVVVANNFLGGKPTGISIFCEGQERMLFEGNNCFPDGYANLVLKNCRHCSVTGNQFQSYYAGLVYLEGASDHNNLTANNLVAQANPASGVWNLNPSQQCRTPDSLAATS